MACRRCDRFDRLAVETTPTRPNAMSSTKMEEPRAMPAAAQGPASQDTYTSPRWQRDFPSDALESLLLSLIAMAAAALLFGLFLALQGHDALAVYRTLYLGALGTRFSIESTLTQAAPLL